MHANLTKTRIAVQLACFSAVLAVSACATFKPDVPDAHPVTNGGNNPVFAEPLDKTTAAQAPRDLATLIFYRPGSGNTNEAPVNVYVNGRFLSSLLPGGYVEHSNCSGAMQVAAVFDDARIRHLGQRGQETALPVEAGKTYYLQVDTRGTGKQAALMPVAADQVFLGQYRRQSHVLARAPTCTAVAAAPVVAAAAPVMASVPLTTPAVGMPVATPVIAAESVRAPLEGWRAAWERGDYAAYTGFYAPEFKGALKSHKAWLDQRRARLNNSAKQIGVNDLAVSTAGDTVVTDFAQIYHSKQFNDDGQKRLVWKQYGSELKIVEEIFAPKK